MPINPVHGQVSALPDFSTSNSNDGGSRAASPGQANPALPNHPPSSARGGGMMALSLRRTISSQALGAHAAMLAVGQEVASAVNAQCDHSKFQACNKLMLQNDPVGERARAKNAYAEANKVFDKYTVPAEATKLAEKSEGHNCYTMSLLAMARLKAHGVNACMMHTTAHACVVIGAIPKGGALPADMKQWPKGIGICDPWSNVVCSASDYPERFHEAMAQWHKNGTTLLDDAGAEIDPENAQWKDNVLGSARSLHTGDFWTKP